MILDDNEMLALAGLSLHIATADQKLTTAEWNEIYALGGELDAREAFSTAITEAERRFKTPDDALAFAADITREDARQFMHTVLSDLANSDGIHIAEADLLGKIRGIWDI